MKKTTLFFSLLLITVLSFSCTGNSGDNKGNENDTSTEVTKQKSSKKSDAEAWDGKLNVLLTKEEAAQISGFEASEADEKYDPEDKYDKSVSYFWKNGRLAKTVLSGTVRELPTLDRVILKSVENVSLERFKNTYRALTDEELNNMNKELDKNAEEGEITESQAEAAKDLGFGLSNLLSFEEVKNVGDYSVWNDKTQELSVYYNEMQFTIEVNISEDNEENKQKAIEAAEMVLKKL